MTINADIRKFENIIHGRGEQITARELDRLHDALRHDREQKRRKRVLEAKQTQREERLKRRLTLADRYLAGYDDDCIEYVKSSLASKGDDELDAIVASERSLHPDKYSQIESYQEVRLIVTALANTYRTEHSDDIEDLLEHAHLFYFDDEAWREASRCKDELERLPYPVCLVEDVLLYERAGEIRETKVAGNADPALSRRMMAFVMGSCSACPGNDSVAYKMTQEALSGIIEVSHVATDKGGNGFPQNIGARSSRSPRAHTRRGHWRNQAYGPNHSLRKRIWISDTIVTPSGKPYRVTDPSRVHTVTLR